MDDEETEILIPPGNETNGGTRSNMHPTWFFLLVGSIYMLIFIVGALGNAIVIYGFTRNRKLYNTVSNSYIWHLAISDFIFVCTLPFWAVDYFNKHSWVFGTFMCKLCRSVSRINMYSSIFFLTALSVDRMIAVTKPTTSTWLRTRRGIRAISISIWIAACIFMLPEAIFSTSQQEAYNHEVCGMAFPLQKNHTMREEDIWYIKMGLYELTKCVFGFFGPICIILYSYSSILYTVQWKLIGSSDGKSRATKLAALIVATFIICWVPFQALTLQSALGGFLEFGMTMTQQQKELHQKIMPYAISLAYTNSAINPIMYAFTLRPFRESLKSSIFFVKFQSRESNKERKSLQYCKVPTGESNNVFCNENNDSRQNSQMTAMTRLTPSQSLNTYSNVISESV